MSSYRLQRLDPAGYRRIPWKNGGGMTVDIAGAVQPGAAPDSWTGMVWRFGRTRIEVPAPFSDLTGYDRILVVIGGRGLVLRTDDGRAIDAREPLRPARFRGDWPIQSELEAGPVEVLNLMGDRSLVSIDMHILDGAGEIDVLPGESVVYAPLGEAELSIDGTPFPLASEAALSWHSGERSRVASRRGCVVVASVAPAARSDA